MVSKPTGRSVGRPKKLIIQTTEKPIGRPRKLLATDVDRYSLAILQAWIDKGLYHGISERNICEAYASLRFGLLTPTTENIDRVLTGKPFQLYFNASDNETQRILSSALGESSLKLHSNARKYPLKGTSANLKEPGLGWHEKNVFRPYADDFRRKLRKIRNKNASDVDRKWLCNMSISWRICLAGDWNMKTHAETLAAIVGERSYFNKEMAQILSRVFTRRARNPSSLDLLSMPEFIRLLIPTR